MEPQTCADTLSFSSQVIIWVFVILGMGLLNRLIRWAYPSYSKEYRDWLRQQQHRQH